MALSLLSSPFTPLSHIGTSMFSRAVTCGTRLNPWNMYPSFSLLILAESDAPRRAASSPTTVRDPFVGLSRSPISLRKVDFPDPERPWTPTNSPLGTSKETDLST